MILILVVFVLVAVLIELRPLTDRCCWGAEAARLKVSAWWRQWANLVRVFVRRPILRDGRVEGARADPLRLSVLVLKACPSNPRISGGAPAGLASSASACDDGKGAEAALF